MENTRPLLLKSAIELFKTYGFTKTSMEEIARLAHKSKVTLYKHFPDKEAILRYLINDDITELKQALTPLLPSGVERPQPLNFKTYLKKRMELISKHPLYKIMLNADESNSTYYFLSDIRAAFNMWEHNLIRDHFSVAAQGKTEFSATAFADMLCMIMKGLEHQFFVTGKYNDYAKTYETMVDLITESITQKLKINS